MSDKSLGNRLKTLRKEKGLTMVQLGEIIDAPQSAISQWESGINRPNINRLKKLANLYGITVEELLQPTVKREIEYNKDRLLLILSFTLRTLVATSKIEGVTENVQESLNEQINSIQYKINAIEKGEYSFYISGGLPYFMKPTDELEHDDYKAGLNVFKSIQVHKMNDHEPINKRIISSNSDLKIVEVDDFGDNLILDEPITSSEQVIQIIKKYYPLGYNINFLLADNPSPERPEGYEYYQVMEFNE